MNNSAISGFRCPGDLGCERFEGSGGATFQERIDNACTGCPRECEPPLDPSEQQELDDLFSTEERNYVIKSVHEIVNDHYAGFKIAINNYEFYEVELFKYWIQLERYFDRNIQVKLGFLVDAFSKKK